MEAKSLRKVCDTSNGGISLPHKLDPQEQLRSAYRSQFSAAVEAVALGELFEFAQLSPHRYQCCASAGKSQII